jgi:hypothetical protein
MSNLTQPGLQEVASARGFFTENLKKYFCASQTHRKQDLPARF